MDIYCDCGCGTEGLCEEEAIRWQAEAAVSRVQTLAEKPMLREAVLVTPELVRRFETIQGGLGSFDDSEAILAAAERRGVSVEQNGRGERIGLRRRYDALGDYTPVFMTDKDDDDIPF